MTTDLRKLAEAATPEAIAKRLRDRALRMEGDPDGVVGNATWLANTAADTIDALTARVAELEEALRPFADKAQRYEPNEDDDKDPAWDAMFKIGDLRRAAAAMEVKP